MLLRTLVVSLLAFLATLAPGAAWAEVTWDLGSLREVYNPPEGIYAYGPSVIDTGRERRIWTCHNSQPRVIRDDIYATRIVDGAVVDDRSVLQASAGGWDSFHVCDPSVVAGRFGFDGRRYSYAMLYLGNDLDASAHNQIGVAFATTLDGPWVKYPHPLVTFDEPTQWGVGQPSALSLRGDSGKLLLFYTRGDTSTRAYVRELDLSDMRQPRVGDAVLVPTTGLTGSDGGPDWLNNYDVALSRDRERLYAIREQHPYPTDNPWWIGASVQLVSADARQIVRGTGTWRVEGTISPALTGLARNHNAGLARTEEGLLPERHRIAVLFTDSCAGPTCDSLFGYDLWELTGRLPYGSTRR
jgi:hypothetical protein